MSDLDRLRSIRQGGKTKGLVRVTKLTEGGKTRGHEIEYHDGRKQAVVNPEAVKYSMSLKES